MLFIDNTNNPFKEKKISKNKNQSIQHPIFKVISLIEANQLHCWHKLSGQGLQTITTIDIKPMKLFDNKFKYFMLVLVKTFKTRIITYTVHIQPLQFLALPHNPTFCMVTVITVHVYIKRTGKEIRHLNN